MAVCLLGTLVMLVPAGAVSAQAAGVAVPPQSQGSCAGEVPIVVGSDAAAQSDVYAAAMLAGVIGSDCIVLAGPRGESMAAAQQARLAAANAGGFVVGGAAAVPDAKVAGRTMTRLFGPDRWATARRVGQHAAGVAPDASATQNVPPRIGGVAVPPQSQGSCAGEVPIVVGSDAAAQSDVYAAAMLAGVIGSDCIVLAGPRDQAMPADQEQRLAAANAGGFVVGGAAAVPTTKIAGRSMTRLSGTDRWATARLVGRRAAGDTTAGTSTSAEAGGSASDPTTGVQASLSCSYSTAFTQRDITLPDGSVLTTREGDFETVDPSDPHDDVTIAFSGGADCTWTLSNGSDRDVRIRTLSGGLYGDGQAASFGYRVGDTGGLLVPAGQTVSAFADFGFFENEIWVSPDGDESDDAYARWVAGGARVVAECGFWTDTDKIDTGQLGVDQALRDHLAAALSEYEHGSEEYFANLAEAIRNAKREVYWTFLTPCSGWSPTSDYGNVSVSAAQADDPQARGS
ncbi:hypothetical protein [Candidatus Poriferisodalis sp.]|uniref:hypothetical protein n=1 Tax=Candidatus Poriferisodalis sp. TaxID=3101277 RepID=UPI003B010F07